MQLSSEALETIVAIDGPAASGKSTLGYLLSRQLNYLFLDTGEMYRAVTLAALQRGVSIRSEIEIVSLARQLVLEITSDHGYHDERKYTIWLDKEDVTWDLRAPAVDANVSQVSAYAGVRQEMVSRQRRIAMRGRAVVVGRDIGTVVLPEAPVKLYIIATAEVRAERRWLEQKERGESGTYGEILADLKRRDHFDGDRVHSPMRPAEDAIIIDTTGRSTEEILAEILQLNPIRRQLHR